MQIRKILVICTGNICRSPMAEALLKKRLAELRPMPTQVSSAGLGALVGHPADEKALVVAAQKNLDLSGHESRQIDAQMVRDADLILVMESSQKRAIESTWTFSRGKVYRLGEWGGFDIDDPYRKDEAAFSSAYALIEQGVEQWMDKIAKL